MEYRISLKLNMEKSGCMVWLFRVTETIRT